MTPPVSTDDGPATRDDVRRLHDKLDLLTRELHAQFVTHADLALLRGEVRDLRSWQAWVARLVIGAVILALVGLVVTADGVTL